MATPAILYDPSADHCLYLFSRLRCPFLLAAISRGEDFTDQYRDLREACASFGDRLAAFVVEAELATELLDALGIEGAPTFLFFAAGEQRAVLLGRSSPERLCEFIAGNLYHIHGPAEV